jgi:hypothetical protein
MEARPRVYSRVSVIVGTSAKVSVGRMSVVKRVMTERTSMKDQ